MSPPPDVLTSNQREVGGVSERRNARCHLRPTYYLHRGRGGYRRIVAAREALAAVEAELLKAVHVARKSGDSWTVIGAALGQSRQAAHRKYAQLLDEA